MTDARAERAALCDLLDQLGPDAPTLCSGWTTADLAAHLVLRERRLDAAGGIALGFLAGYTESVQRGIKNRPFPELVDLVRQGPPIWSPYGFIPGADAVVNTTEMFIHHEDIRRAQPNWEPRKLSAEAEDRFWSRVTKGARLFLRKAPVGIVLRRTSGERAAGHKAEPAVIVTGEPSELMLFSFGRQRHARVTLDGDETARERLMDAHLGI